MIRTYDYGDIHLISRQISEVNSRDSVDTSVTFCGAKLEVPIVASPMKDVADVKGAIDIVEAGAFVFLHRFNTIAEQVKMFAAVNKISLSVGCALGINGDFQERLEALYHAGCRRFCLDVANSANKNIEPAIYAIKELSPYNHVVVGNVMSREGFEYNSRLPCVKAVRVGVGGGAGCTTTNATGLYHPAASLISECATKRSYGNTLIIADGGLREPGDMCKALAMGADVVMLGSALAGCTNSAAPIQSGYKVFSGSASEKIQESYREPRYIEGQTIRLPSNEENMSQLIKRWQDGIRSCMSYCGATNISDFRIKVDYVVNS